MKRLNQDGTLSAATLKDGYAERYEHISSGTELTLYHSAHAEEYRVVGVNGYGLRVGRTFPNVAAARRYVRRRFPHAERIIGYQEYPNGPTRLFTRPLR